MGNRQRVVTLRDTKLAEIFPLGAVAVHVVLGDQRERGVGSARSIGIDRILGEARKRRQRLAKRIHVVGVAADTSDDLRVSSLYGSRGPTQRHDAAGAAERDVIKPAR